MKLSLIFLFLVSFQILAQRETETLSFNFDDHDPNIPTGLYQPFTMAGITGILYKSARIETCLFLENRPCSLPYPYPSSYPNMLNINFGLNFTQSMVGGKVVRLRFRYHRVSNLNEIQTWGISDRYVTNRYSHVPLASAITSTTKIPEGSYSNPSSPYYVTDQTITLESPNLEHIQSLYLVDGFSSINFIDDLEITYIPDILNGNLSVGDVILEQNGEQVQDYGQGNDFGQLDLLRGVPTKVKASINVNGFDDANQSQISFNVCLEVKDKYTYETINYTRFMRLSGFTQGNNIVEFNIPANYTTNPYDFTVTVDCNETVDDTNRSDNVGGVAGRYTNGGDFALADFNLVQNGVVNPGIEDDGIIDLKTGFGVEIPTIEITAEHLELSQINQIAYDIVLIDQETNQFVSLFYAGRTINKTEFINGNGKVIETPEGFPVLDALTLDSRYLLLVGLYDPVTGGDIYDYAFGNNIATRVFKLYTEEVEKKIDLSFDAKIGQVFQLDPSENIELVQNKEADVLVKPMIVGEDDKSVPRDTVVEISAKQGTQDLNIILPGDMTNVTVGDIKNWGARGPIIFDGLDTSVVGTSSVSIEMKLPEGIDGSHGSDQGPINFIVSKTYPLNIGFINFSGCSDGAVCYGSVNPSFFNTQTGNPRQIISDIFPLTDNQISFGQIRVAGRDFIAGSPDIKEIREGETAQERISRISPGVFSDLNRIGEIKSQKKELYNRVIGLVPSTYRDHHEGDFDGIADYVREGKYSHPAAIVLDDASDRVLAHELVHTLLGDGVSNVDENGHAFDLIKNAYSQRENTVLSNNTVENIMLPADGGKRYWFDINTYKNIFELFKNPIVDPKVIVISGLINKDGEVIVEKTFISETGVFTPNPDAGNIDINSIDQDGIVINNFKFDLDFKLVKYPVGLVDVETEPFVISIPYSDQISRIEISVDDEVKIDFDPFSKSLVDTIESIDSTIQLKGKKDRFKKIRKKILNRTVKRFQYYLDQSDHIFEKCSQMKSRRHFRWKKRLCVKKAELYKVRAKLVIRLLERLLKKWMNDNDGINTNKESVLNLINDVRERL